MQRHFNRIAEGEGFLVAIALLLFLAQDGWIFSHKQDMRIWRESRNWAGPIRCRPLVHSSYSATRAVEHNHRAENGMIEKDKPTSKVGQTVPTTNAMSSSPLEADVKISKDSAMSLSSNSSSRFDTTSDYVWYGSYASNMCTSRFMCYIEGGQAEGMANPGSGARNRAPPVSSCWVKVPHTLFFGHSWSRTWGSGGVAFLNPISHGGSPTTHIRLYKITLQQLNDVLIQENEGNPNNSELSLSWDDINRLQNLPASSHSTLDFIESSWYGTLKCLGSKDGIPILTITCSLADLQKFRDGQIQICLPSDSYRRVILRGLLEQGLSKEESQAYIESKFKNLVNETP